MATVWIFGIEKTVGNPWRPSWNFKKARGTSKKVGLVLNYSNLTTAVVIQPTWNFCQVKRNEGGCIKNSKIKERERKPREKKPIQPCLIFKNGQEKAFQKTLQSQGHFRSFFMPVRQWKRPCLNLGDEAGERRLLLLTGVEVLVPLHQRLQCEYQCIV